MPGAGTPGAKRGGGGGPNLSADAGEFALLSKYLGEPLTVSTLATPF